MKALSLLLLFCSYVVYAQVSELSFNIGDQFAYDLHATLDSKGNMVATGQRSSGAWSTMDSTVVIQCTDKDDTSFLFVMNMWNTDVNVGQGLESPSTKQNVGDWLGDDCYFQQLKTGEITNIWYESDDDPYLVQVKIGAINAFQTHIVPGDSTQQFTELDPVGSHVSVFTGITQPTSALMVNKTFTEKDVDSFADTNLHQSNVQLNALTSTVVHPQGYIQASTVNQLVNLVNLAPAGETYKMRKLGVSDTSALDLQFSSYGSLGISISNNAVSAPSPRTKLNRRALNASPSLVSGSLLDASRRMITISKSNQELDLAESLSTIIKSPKKEIKMMNKVIRYLNANPTSIPEFLTLVKENYEDSASRQKLLYILAGISEQDPRFLVTLMSSGTQKQKLAAVMAASGIQKPTSAVVDSILRVIETSSNSELKNSALFVLGTLGSRTADRQLARRIASVLLQGLGRALSQERVSEIVTFVHAIGNAGPNVIPFDFFPSQLAAHDDVTVRVALVNALRKFTKNPRAAALLNRMSKLDTDTHVQKSIAKLVTFYEISDNSDFPFNKSYNAQYTLGGSQVNLKFQGELFAGTNFDCNQQYFNYEALAEADATGTLFSWTKNVFSAEGIYGKANGQLVGNQILVKVWDDVIYDKQLPTVDCNEHTYEIGHTSPGFNVQYVLWVSVIPVVFSAGATLDLDLSWGWQICDSSLLAMVELIPSATLTIDGTAEIDLLIIKAGVELSGSFNSQLRPQGYIHGSECAVGFDIQQDNTPMDIAFTAYYAWKHCKFLIFDCHWGQHNVHTIFDWSTPSNSQIIFDKEWKIQP